MPSKNRNEIRFPIPNIGEEEQGKYAKKVQPLALKENGIVGI
jgi:hypothetical protein